MEILNVLVAAVGAFAFGAAWYMSLAKQWMAATGISDAQQQSAGSKPYIIAMVGCIFTAGMMRHIFAAAAITSVGSGIAAGLGIGLFIAAPWIINNCAFEGRPASLMWINGGYAVGGSTIIGFILTLF